MARRITRNGIQINDLGRGGELNGLKRQHAPHSFQPATTGFNASTGRRSCMSASLMANCAANGIAQRLKQATATGLERRRGATQEVTAV
jgi:hypothetical protein